IFHFTKQAFSGQVPIKNHVSCAGIYKRRGVLALMVVSGKRQGHENRCHSCRCDFTDTSGSGTPEYQIGLRKRCRHVANERNDLAFEAGSSELGRQLLRGARSALMDNPDWSPTASE